MDFLYGINRYLASYNQDSSVGLVSTLQTRRSSLCLSAEMKHFSHLPNFHAVSGSHPATYSMDNWVLSSQQRGRGR
jgi:hypothetical protein